MNKVRNLFFLLFFFSTIVVQAGVPVLSIDKNHYEPDPAFHGYYHTAQGVFSFSAIPEDGKSVLVIACDGSQLSRVLLLPGDTIYRRTFLFGGAYTAYIERTEEDSVREKSNTVEFTVQGRYKALNALRYIWQRLPEVPFVIDISEFAVPDTGLEDVLLRENLNMFIGRAQWEKENGYYKRVTLNWGISRMEARSMFAYLENTVENLLPFDATDLQKAFLLYAYINTYGNVIYKASSHANDLYGPAWARECVCEGYALMMSALSFMSGLDCVKGGSGDISHAWNVVGIDGEWYQVDATWEYNEARRLTYTWFGHSDADFIESHTSQHQEITWSCSGVRFPPCPSNGLRDKFDNIPYFQAPDGGFYITENGNTIWLDADLAPVREMESGVTALDYVLRYTGKNSWFTVSDTLVETGSEIQLASGLPFHTKIREKDYGYTPEIVYEIVRDNQVCDTVPGSAFGFSGFVPTEPGVYGITAVISDYSGRKVRSKTIRVQVQEEIEMEDVRLDLALSSVRIMPNGYEYQKEFHEGKYRYAVTGKTETNSISSVGVDRIEVVFTDLTVLLSEKQRRAVDFSGAKEVYIRLEGNSSLKAGHDAPALDLGSSKAVIEGNGRLTASGGEYWSGVRCVEGGLLTIREGDIVALGGANGSGIGGSWGFAGGDVVIDGGCVTAEGQRGAGIGSGAQAGFTGRIEINGGSVKASGAVVFGGTNAGTEIDPVNKEEDVLRLYTVSGTRLGSLSVNGKPYVLPERRHPDDDRFYLWLPLSGEAVANDTIRFALEDGFPDILNETSISRPSLTGNLQVRVQGKVLSVSGISSGEIISVYSTTGVRVYSGTNREISLPASGLYLVRSEREVRKVMVP